MLSADTSEVIFKSKLLPNKRNSGSFAGVFGGCFRPAVTLAAMSGHKTFQLFEWILGRAADPTRLSSGSAGGQVYTARSVIAGVDTS